MMEEKRRSKSGEQSEKVRGMSFDDLVDREGKLKEAEDAAKTTALEAGGLRHRNIEAASLADPFSDEKHALMDFSGQNTTRETTMLPNSPSQHPRPDLLIDTSSPAPLTSDQPLDRTPIALSPPKHSPSHTPSIHTPTSPVATPNPHQPQTDTYLPINEWAENSTSFYSPPRSVQGETVQQGQGINGIDLAGLEAGMEELVNMSDAAMSDMDVDMVSEVGEGKGRSTPGSWTEVGSVVSGDD